MEVQAAHGGAGRTVARAVDHGWSIIGDLGVDGAWTLDRYLDPDVGVTATGDLLERSWARPMSRPTAALGVRMAALLSSRTWPADLVVVPVPSSSAAPDVLARVVAHVLERESRRLLVSRRGRRHAPADRRFAVGHRRVPDHVLLVDDVVRSGDTIAACAELLRSRGAVRVWAVTATVEEKSVGRRVASGSAATELPAAMVATVDALVPSAFGERPSAVPSPDEPERSRVRLFDQEVVDRSAAPEEQVAAEVDLEPVESVTPVEAAMLTEAGLLDDEELMAAVGRAFEAIAGLEALQKIVEQVAPDEAVSIEGLLSELLAVDAAGAADAVEVDEAVELDAIDDEVDHEVDAVDAVDDEVDAVDDEVDAIASVDQNDVDEDAEATATVDEADLLGPADDVDPADDAVGSDDERDVDAPHESDEDDESDECDHVVAEPSAGLGASPMAGWRGRRRRQKPKPSTMR